jgi:hypothetical protein
MLTKAPEDRMIVQGQNRGAIDLGEQIQERMTERQKALVEVEQRIRGLRDRLLIGNGKRYEDAVVEFLPLQGRAGLLRAELEELARRFERNWIPALRARAENAQAAEHRFRAEQYEPVQARYRELKLAVETAKSELLVFGLGHDQRIQMRRALIDLEAEKGRAKLEVQLIEEPMCEVTAAAQRARDELVRAEGMLKAARRPGDLADEPGEPVQGELAGVMAGQEAG